jgi:hypothetical protein
MPRAIPLPQPLLHALRASPSSTATGPGGKVILLSYASGSYLPSMSLLMKEARALHSFDVLLNYSQADIAPAYAAVHAARLRLHRGGGYFLWKPYFILRTLEGMEEGDTLMYVDAGCTFVGGSPQPWIDLAKQHGFLAFRLEHPEAFYTKADMFEALDVDMGLFGRERQVLSGIILFQRTPKTLGLVRAWKACVEDLHLVDDSPSVKANHPGFIENRHDQSCFSLLVHKMGMAPVLEDPTWPEEGAGVIFASRRGKG